MTQTASPAGVGATRAFAWRRPGGAGGGQLGTAAVLLGVWVVLILGTSLFKPRFFGAETFTAISYTAVALAPLCIGLAVVTISGSGLDISGGVVASIATLFCAQLMSGGHTSGETILIVLAFGAAVGAVNGTLVAALGLDPVVATLATNFIGIGIIELQSIVLSMPAHSALRSFSFGTPLGVTNLAWVALALLLAVEVFLRSTSRGRHVVALGGSAVAAVRQGISRGRIRFMVFVFSGTCAALGGIMFAGSSDLVRGEVSTTREFQAISVVLLSGISLGGGRGRALSLISGLLVIVTIPTAIATLGVTGAWSNVIQGGVLAVALGIDGRRAQRRSTR